MTSHIAQQQPRRAVKLDRCTLWVLVEIRLEPRPVLQGAISSLAVDFDECANSTRLVLLVSPTCSRCLEGSSLVAKVLRERPKENVRVLVLSGARLALRLTSFRRYAYHVVRR